MNRLIINNQIIPFQERRSIRYRRITLSILEDHLRISAPRGVSSKQLQEFLLAKQDWILKHWLANSQAAVQPKGFGGGEQFLYRGKLLELKILRHPRRTVRVSLEGQVLGVYLPQDLEDEESANYVHTALLSWYKSQARGVILDKLIRQSKRMQVTFQAFRLKDQKTCWGSCSSKGNLNFNWRIIMAPDEAIDYIIVHELAHLTHLNHSEKFWRRVEEFMPNYTYWQKWFKEHGKELRLRTLLA